MQGEPGGGNLHALHKAAGHVVVAGDGGNHEDGPAGVHGVDALLKGAALLQSQGLGGANPPGGGQNLLLRNAGDVGNFWQVNTLYTAPQRLKAVGVVFHKVMVIEILREEQVQNTKSQGSVGARPDPKPELGLFGQLRGFGVDDHNGNPSLTASLMNHCSSPSAPLTAGLAPQTRMPPGRFGP